MTKLRVLVLLIAAVLSTGLPGLPSIPGAFAQEAAPAAGDATTAAINMEAVDIKELVRWIAHLTGRNIVVHPDVKGEVTVLGGAPLTPQDAYRVFLSVLQVHGLTVVDHGGNTLQVVPAQAATQGGAPFDDEGAAAHFGEDVVVRVLRIRNVPADQVVSALRPLMPTSALLAAYPDSNLLIVADRAANIERLLEVIGRIDQASTLDIEVVDVRYARATELLETLKALLPGVAGATTGGRGLDVAVDRHSNSLLLKGDPLAREPLRALIRRLDVAPEGTGNTQVFHLDYADPATLVPVLNNIATAAAGQNGDASQATATRIEALPDRNAVLVTAGRDVMDSLRSLIVQLDTRAPQVLIEAIIVEVNNEDLSDLGIRWRTNLPEDGTFGAVGLLPDSLAPAVPPAIAGGLTLAHIEGGSLRALLRALETTADANLLSTPTLVTLDNRPASILVGENVPFITGAATGAASSTTNPFQTIERHDIGLTLKVRPRVNRDGVIQLSIEQTVEAVTDSAAQTADIVTSKRSIQTDVLIEDGATLVLGGLIRDELSQKKSKVPLLGSIPVLGRAFRSTSNQFTKKNLMVFIRPKVLRTAADTAQATAVRYQRLQSLQETQSRDTIDRFLIPGMKTPVLPAIDPPAPAAPQSDIDAEPGGSP